MSSSGDVGRVVVRVEDARSPGASSGIELDLDRWRVLAAACLDAEGASGTLDLTFVDVAEIAELNEQHLGGSGPTDVLSFPLDGADEWVSSSLDGPSDDDVPRLLGDVVISPEVAARQFNEHAGTLDDELALLVVHGLLHVLGHDHAEPEETETMRRLERSLLERFHWHGPAPSGFRQDHPEP